MFMEKIKFRIQLASNFQVVEFDLEVDSINDLTLDNCVISAALDLVNDLGKNVGNDIKPQRKLRSSNSSKNKSSTELKVDKLPSDKQIAYAERLGLAPEKARTMSSEEIWNWINNNK